MWMTLGRVGIATLVIALWAYLKYSQAKRHSDQREERADIRTLFSGRK
jgi:hypothetical protein